MYMSMYMYVNVHVCSLGCFGYVVMSVWPLGEWESWLAMKILNPQFPALKAGLSVTIHVFFL